MRQSLSPSRMVMSGEANTQRPAKGLDNAINRDDKYEIKSGQLLLQHRIGKRMAWLPVFVRVYRNAFEHFAVISKDQVISSNSTYVNLRSSHSAVPGETLTQFKVVQNNYEGTVINFDASNKDDVHEWVDAFMCATPPCSPTTGGMSPTLSPAIPRSPVMPTLSELDEEE
ncbi:uncharacterized protein [Littorina saxatilis]|uniref:PH domain-containing protein n=1 Tax=Littorina saxatilis TaxID=31220 RepID=A0AAN9B1E6_9CAEN